MKLLLNVSITLWNVQCENRFSLRKITNTKISFNIQKTSILGALGPNAALSSSAHSQVWKALPSVELGCTVAGERNWIVGAHAGMYTICTQ